MGKEFPPETVFRAQELYCVDRLTFDQVAEQAGVSVSQLKRWAEKFEWQKKREEIAQAALDIRSNFLLARSRLLKELLDKANPQTGFAVACLERLAMLKDATGKKATGVKGEPGGQAAEGAKPKGMTEETADAIRRLILGINA